MSARGSTASADAAAPRPTASDAAPEPATNGAGEAPLGEQAPPTTAAARAREGGSSGPREWAWGAIVVIAGLIAIVAVFVFAVLQYKTAAEVTTAVGAVSGVIAALVGAYFGIRGASLAQSNAESSNAKSSQKNL